MPARIVVTMNEQDFAVATVAVLRDQGFDAVAIHDPMAAIDALEAASRIELLVTCLEFGENKPNGIALARMARFKRPGTKVLFVGDEVLAVHTDGVGDLLPSPVTVEQVVEKGVAMMETRSPHAAC